MDSAVLVLVVVVLLLVLVLVSVLVVVMELVRQKISIGLIWDDGDLI